MGVPHVDWFIVTLVVIVDLSFVLAVPAISGGGNCIERNNSDHVEAPNKIHHHVVV
jgi:hypothetical protein